MRICNGLILKAIVAGVAFAAVVGCGGGGGGGSSAPKPVVRFFNASPDSSTISVLFNTTVRADHLAYLASTPGFATISPADYDVFLRDDGTGDILDGQTLTASSDTSFIILSAGLINFGTENLKRARLMALAVDKKDPNGSKARLYFVHAFNRAPGFDTPAVDFQSPGDNPQYKLTAIDFANSDTLTVDSGSQAFEARRTGTENIYASATQVFDAGGVYLVELVGTEDQVGAQAPQLVFTKLN